MLTRDMPVLHALLQGKQQQWTVTFKHGDTECVATLGSSWLVKVCLHARTRTHKRTRTRTRTRKGHFSDAPFAVETADDEEPAGDSDLEEALEEELDAERNPDQVRRLQARLPVALPPHPPTYYHHHADHHHHSHATLCAWIPEL